MLPSVSLPRPNPTNPAATLDAVPADEPLLRRFRLDTKKGDWEMLEDEELEGEGSDDEDQDTDGVKRQRVSVPEEEIVLD